MLALTGTFLLSSSVHTFQSAVEVLLQRHRLLRSAKIVGHTKIALPNLQDGAIRHEWYPVTEYLSPKKLQKNFKKEAATIGEIRLEVQYKPLQTKVEKHYKGIVIEVFLSFGPLVHIILTVCAE
jgi:hypothetical protein